MELNRFTEINSTLTCISDKDYVNNSRKVSPCPKIFSYINSNFLKSREHDEHLSIDESTIPFQGNVNFKVYNPNKPEKFGMKIYMISSPKDRYIFKMRICSVSSTLEEIILDLLKEFKSSFHKVFMDNFYNSFKIAKLLLEKKTYVCGTLRIRRGGPKELKEIKKGLKVGEIKSFQKEKVNVFVFKEKLSKDAVSIISTFHEVADCTTLASENSIVVKTNTESNITDFSTQTPISKSKPVFINDYNKYMKGVDLSDQLMKNYSPYRKSRRWVNKMTVFILQTALNNSFIEYKKKKSKSSKPV